MLAPTPCDIVHEMHRLEDAILADDAAAERYCEPGRLLVQTKGTTPLDALAFLKTAAVLIVSRQTRIYVTASVRAPRARLASARRRRTLCVRTSHRRYGVG